MTVEFDCEGCGIHVVAIVAEEIPAHGLCATCAFVCEHAPGPGGVKALDFVNGKQAKTEDG